jgi:predicted metallo-beta-lactamase superfamily hydrolase
MVEEDKRFLFTSDVQGPLNCGALDFVFDVSPHIMLVDGPATYLLGSHYKKADIELSLENLRKIIDRIKLTNLILDHHLLRDLKWLDYVNELGKIKHGMTVSSAAGFLGKKEDQLEAKRKDMYNGQPL